MNSRAPHTKSHRDMIAMALPGRSFASPADFDQQLADWLLKANARTVCSIAGRPVDLLDSLRAALDGAAADGETILVAEGHGTRWPHRQQPARQGMEGTAMPIPGDATLTHQQVPPLAVLEQAMRAAIAIAERAKTPFGAVLLETSRSTIAYTATNKRLNGPFAHAELNVLRSALRQRVELGGLVLVSTAEPCPMCAGAAILAQVSALVFGTSITTLAKRGGRQIVVPSTYLATHFKRLDTKPDGPLAEEVRTCWAVLQRLAKGVTSGAIRSG